MYKKTLQIQTNFLQEEDPHATLVTTSKINYQQKLQAAILFQKSLSMILARNFIECWKQLKSSQALSPRIRKNRAGNSRQNMNVEYFQQERYNVIQNQVPNRVPKARSQSQIQKYLKTSQSEDVYQQYRVRRNRSVRVINQQVQHSRATVLKQIVEKLKNVRKCQEQSSQQQDNTNKEVLKRISHLQRLVKGIRNTSKSQLNILRTTIQQHRLYDQQQTQPDPNIQDEELVRQFMDQVYQIRKEVNQIKINNQAILRAQLERSQVRSQARSQVSSHSSKHRPNSQQQQPVYKKQYISSGVQTQIHTKNQSQVTEMQPTLSQIEQKHKKLSQQIQINSKPARLTVTNGTSGSSTNLGLGNLFPLGASNTQTNQTDKFHFNSFNKYPGISNPTTFVQKQSPPQASDFGNVSSGLQYKPFPTLTSTNYSNNLGSLGTSQPTSTQPSPSLYTSPSMPSNPSQPNSYQIPTNMSFTSPPTFNLPPQPQPFINYPPPRQPTAMFPTYNAPMNVPPPINMKPTISFEYPKFDHIRTNTSVESKNYIISDLGSSNSLMTKVQQPQIRHYRQPSFFVQEETRRNVALSTYCPTCGRSCGCPSKTFHETRRF